MSQAPFYVPSNVDRNVSEPEIQRYIEAHGNHTTLRALAVSAVFATFQGEMPFAGRPAVFVRLAGCNRGAKLDCMWCDTRFHLSEAEILEPARLAELVVDKFEELGIEQHGRPPLIVISGGEPTMQMSGLKSFFNELTLKVRNKNYWPHPALQFETNGDYLGKLIDAADDQDHSMFADYVRGDKFNVVVSPKAHPQVGYNEKIGDLFRELNLTRAHAFVRCVVSCDKRDRYHELPKWVHDVNPTQVYLSPICVYDGLVDHGKVIDFWSGSGINRPRTGANYVYAQQLAAQYGFNLSTQSHLLFNIE